MAIATDPERARSLDARAAQIRAAMGRPTDNQTVAGFLAQIDGDFDKAAELTSFEAADPAWYALPGYATLRVVHALSLSSLGRHQEAVAATRDIPGNIIRSPTSSFAVRVAWVLVRAGLAQEALDLIARPTRSALGVAIEQWRFGRSLVLAEYVFDRDPDLAARLIGCVPVSATLTLGLLRDEILKRARAVLGDRSDDLLAQGATAGEKATVAEAYAVIRADGLTLD